MTLQRVLIAEDHVTVRDHLVARAEDMFGPVELRLAKDRDALLEQPNNIDCAIIDPGLPGFDANDEVGRLQCITLAYEKMAADGRAVVLTGNYTLFEATAATNLGYQGYFDKAHVSVDELASIFRGRRTRLSAETGVRYSMLTTAEQIAIDAMQRWPNDTHDVISARLDLSIEAFRQNLKRARKRLREFGVT